MPANPLAFLTVSFDFFTFYIFIPSTHKKATTTTKPQSFCYLYTPYSLPFVEYLYLKFFFPTCTDFKNYLYVVSLQIVVDSTCTLSLYKLYLILLADCFYTDCSMILPLRYVFTDCSVILSLRYVFTDCSVILLVRLMFRL